MGILEKLLKHAAGGTDGLGDLVTTVSKNPQIAAALASLLSTRDASVGGNGGLAGLVAAFQQKGLGGVVSQWISTGPNPPVSVEQVTEALGPETLGQFATKAGVPPAEAGALLARILPTAIDRLTPEGRLPEAGALDSSLASLLSMFGQRMGTT